MTKTKPNFQVNKVCVLFGSSVFLFFSSSFFSISVKTVLFSEYYSKHKTKISLNILAQKSIGLCLIFSTKEFTSNKLNRMKAKTLFFIRKNTLTNRIFNSVLFFFVLKFFLIRNSVHDELMQFRSNKM